MGSRGRRWLLRHTKARNAMRARYYRKHRYQRNGRGPNYSPKENRMVVLHQVCDVSLAQALHRSVASIQIQRTELRHFAKDPLRSEKEKLDWLGVDATELAAFIARGKITDPVPGKVLVSE